MGNATSIDDNLGALPAAPSGATGAQGQGRPVWYSSVAPFVQADAKRATWQLVETLVPYAVVWAAMASLVNDHPFVALALSVPAAGLLVRVFILFHDCCHGSLFPSPRMNRIVGYVTGVLTLTPFDRWKRAHAQHHATVGDLDRRGVGDVWTLTVNEYLAAPPLKRLLYRLFRNPLVMFGIGPIFVFVVEHRFCPRDGTGRERFSVYLTNVAAAAAVTAACLTIGTWNFLSILAPVGLLGGAAGIWLFYVQHQFEGVYWSRHESWDPWRAALAGSSYYKLPKVLQWFTGSIGLHHIHHVQPRIPSYALQQCQESVPAFQEVPPLTLLGSLRLLRLRLWDEGQRRMVRWADVRAGRQGSAPDQGAAAH